MQIADDDKQLKMLKNGFISLKLVIRQMLKKRIIHLYQPIRAVRIPETEPNEEPPRTTKEEEQLETF